jgi:NADH dehydrogenase [ubiquinone] 1 alpha subcomplex assembly factor 6
MGQDEAEYCAAQVRRFDRDRWLCILLAPSGAQRDLLALAAFNLELARIREQIREPHMALIRLQWWRDAVAEAGAGRPRQNPVCRELARLAAGGHIELDALGAMIDAREKDIDEAPCGDLAELIAYTDATAGILAEQSLRACGLVDTAGLAAARAVGRGWALTGLLRAAPFHAASRRCLMPTQALARAGVSLESWYAGRPEPGARAVVSEVAGAAAAQLAADAARRLPRAAFAVTGLRVLARAHLRRLEAAGGDVFAPALQAPMPLAAARLALAKFVGRW